MGNEEILSDDGRASNRFLWFSLASLERMASLQVDLQDEDLERLDSASALHAHPAARQVVSQYRGHCRDLEREESGSSHGSIADLPIELPHLEDEDEMYKLGRWSPR